MITFTVDGSPEVYGLHENETRQAAKAAENMVKLLRRHAKNEWGGFEVEFKIAAGDNYSDEDTFTDNPIEEDAIDDLATFEVHVLECVSNGEHDHFFVRHLDSHEIDDLMEELHNHERASVDAGGFDVHEYQD